MTVIAWDGRTLAGDRMMRCGQTAQRVRKVFRLRCGLVGIAGSSSVAAEVLHWLDAGAEPRVYPTLARSDDNGCHVLLVRPDLTVWRFDLSPYPNQLMSHFAAIGSGEETALACMDLGADAETAIRVTSRYNSTCGLGFDTVDFQSPVYSFQTLFLQHASQPEDSIRPAES